MGEQLTRHETADTIRVIRMMRKLLIVVFVMSVAANAIAAVAPVVEGDSACGGCCSAARRNEPRVSPAKLCCLTDCGQPGESQRSTPPSLIKTEREDKSASPAASVLPTAHAIQAAGFLYSPARAIVQSTHIYFRTGALLI
jgi:hypothetical protein